MHGIGPALGVLLALAFAGARAEERPPVHAEDGSVAIGGNVTNSTIGLTPEQGAGVNQGGCGGSRRSACGQNRRPEQSARRHPGRGSVHAPHSRSA
jgi:hypothetical protein